MKNSIKSILSELAEHTATLEKVTHDMFSWHNQKTKSDDAAKFHHTVAQKKQDLEAFLEAKREERNAARAFENLRDCFFKLMFIHERMSVLQNMVSQNTAEDESTHKV